MHHIYDSVLMIHCVGARIDALQPWQMLEQEAWTGSGFCVKTSNSKVVITNAHVADNSFIIQLSRQGDTTKYTTKILCTAHELDLAILELPLQLTDITPLILQKTIPKLFQDVRVFGYPEGGNNISITKGVISRIDVQLYAYAASLGFDDDMFESWGNLLRIQVDAAINSGNSGGPSIDETGLVVGAASSALENAQNIGYVIPSLFIELMLSQYDKLGEWKGVCEPGFVWRSLECSSLRNYLGMEFSATGVLITSLAPLGTLSGLIHPGDVLIAIDDRVISNEGTILLATEEAIPVHFHHAITSKALGSKFKLSFLRKGKTMEAEVAFPPIPSCFPRFQSSDAKPCFVIFGGLVFTRLSMPVLTALQEKQSVPLNLHRRWKQTANEEILILLNILRHPVNVGMGYGNDLRSVIAVNDVDIKTLKDLLIVTMLKIKKEPYLVYHFKSLIDESRSMEVFESKDVLQANTDIQAQHLIGSCVSDDLIQYYDVDDIAKTLQEFKLKRPKTS